VTTQTIHRKQFTIAPLGPREFEGKASDPSLDRMNDRVLSTAWRLDNFRANPVLLYMHNYDAPIGVVTQIGVDAGGSLVFRAEFAPEGVSDWADKACGLVKAGMLKTVSVGFRPIEWEDNAEGGVDFTAVELLEISVVSVPAHPDAVITAKTFAADDDRHVLDLDDEELGLTGAETVVELDADVPVSRALVLEGVRDVVGAGVQRRLRYTMAQHDDRHVGDVSDEVALDPEDVRSAMREAVPALVREAAVAELKRLRGRLPD